MNEQHSRCSRNMCGEWMRGMEQPTTGWPEGAFGAQGTVEPTEAGYYRPILCRVDGDWKIETLRIVHNLPMVFPGNKESSVAAFMARSQVLNLADNFKAVITTAAWRKQTKLGAASGSGQSHQSRSRTVVCHASQQPQGRSLRCQSCGLRIQGP